jgi:uncharacterized protein YndB with AHSA1/START domain
MSDFIEKSVLIAASRSRVWRALTDFREFGKWFRVALDGPFIEGKAVTGRITYAGYEHLRFTAMVKKIEPEHTFAYTWHPYAIDPAKDYSGETPTLVEFTLKDEAGGIRLHVIESGFDKLPPSRRDEAFRMNEGGWGTQMTNIAEHILNAP